MRRRTTIITCAVLTVLAAVLGLLAWRADAPAVSTTASSAAPPSTSSPVVSTTAAAAPADTAATSTVALPTVPATSAAAATPEPTVAIAGPDDACPGGGHGAVVDRASQRAWLCD